MRLHTLVGSMAMLAAANGAAPAQTAGANDGWIYAMRTTSGSRDGRGTARATRGQLNARMIR